MADLQRSVFPWIHSGTEQVKPHQTVTAEEVARTHGVPHPHLVTYLKNEIKEAEACMSLPFTLMLVVSYSIMAIAHDDAITVRGVEDSLEDDIVENANFAFTGAYMGHKNIYDVNSHADFWAWMSVGLLPLVGQQERSFHESYDTTNPLYKAAEKKYGPKERGYWLHYNRIVGGIRMVQERSGEPNGFKCKTMQQLIPLYRQRCVGGLDYSLEPELGLPNERAQTTINPTRQRWLYIFDDYQELQAKLLQLEKEEWLDRLTKKIELAIPVYNAEFGLHTLVRINFCFSRGGHIWKSVIPQSQYADWHDRWYYGLYDGIWLLCLLYIFVMEIVEVQHLVRTKGVCSIFTQYLDLYNAIDWLSVVGGLVIVALFVNSIGMRTEMNEYLEKLGTIDMETSRDQYVDIVGKYFTSVEVNVNYITTFRKTLALYPLIIVFRLFKSFAAQPRLALVTNTLMKAAPDLFHFMIVFGSVFITFMICGIVLFGREVTSFTTVSRAAVMCFRMLLGDIDWPTLSVIGRMEAAIWLWLFIIIVVLLMLNMVLAIVMDNYEEVKEATGYAETLWEEGIQVWKRWVGKRRGTYISLGVILEAVYVEVARGQKKHISNANKAKTVSSFFSGMLKHIKNADEDDDEQGNPDDYTIIITPEVLIQAVSRSGNVNVKLTETQSVEVITGAINDFYEANKTGAELFEVLQITQKISARVKKLTRLTKQAQEIRDTGPVEELSWFGSQLFEYLEEVKKERATNKNELETLINTKIELEQRLMRFEPNALFDANGHHVRKTRKRRNVDRGNRGLW